MVKITRNFQNSGESNVTPQQQEKLNTNITDDNKNDLRNNTIVEERYTSVENNQGIEMPSPHSNLTPNSSLNDATTVIPRVEQAVTQPLEIVNENQNSSNLEKNDNNTDNSKHQSVLNYLGGSSTKPKHYRAPIDTSSSEPEIDYDRYNSDNQDDEDEAFNDSLFEDVQVEEPHSQRFSKQETDISKVKDIDIEDLAGAAKTFYNKPEGRKLTRKEKKQKKKEIEAARSAVKASSKATNKDYSSVKKQLKERDKELSDRTKEAKEHRLSAKDIINYLGYNSMFIDGVCEVEEGLYSQTLAFEDTSYHSVRDDMQKGMFASMCRLYDQFGADTLLQMNVINTPLLAEDVGRRQFFDPKKQSNAEAAHDAAVFNDILNKKMSEGVSNIRRSRFLTYSTSAETADAAVPKLARIENSARHIFTSMNSRTHLLNGTERLELLHSQLSPEKPFTFDYKTDVSTAKGMSTKDAIAPLAIDWSPAGFSDCFKVDGMWGQVLVMRAFGSELSDRALADIADLPIPLNISWFIQPIDKAKAIAMARQTSAWIDKEVIEEQRSAVNKGYDFSILPHELKYSKEETEDLLDHLQNKNQRLYHFTGLVYTYAETKEKLDERVLQIISAARQNSIEVDVYDLRQKQALNSILPLGHNHTEISRTFTSAQVGILIPFATQELNDKNGNYCGQNKHSRNLIFCNRKLLTSPMGFVCGKTGSGKGMFVKTEMTGTIFNNPSDEIYVIDRAGEYTSIAERYDGSVYTFGVGSETYLNPFDTVSVNHMTENEQIAFKIDAMLAQAGASAAEAGTSLSEVDQSIITRCVEQAFLARTDKSTPPLLEDFYNILIEQPEREAHEIALRYERFVKGSMSFFNHHTNVDFEKRIVDFNLKEIPDAMLVFALINVCEAVRNRMYFNAKRGVNTWLYIEEMQSMFAYPTVLQYFSRFSNEGRKFGMLLTGITQNAVAMLKNDAAQNIVLNADFLMLLKQSPLDRQEWTHLLNLSEQEEECIDESVEAGDGLLLAGAARVPVRGKFPSGNSLYDLFSTNPNEYAERERAKEFRAKQQNNQDN